MQILCSIEVVGKLVGSKIGAIVGDAVEVKVLTGIGDAVTTMAGAGVGRIQRMCARCRRDGNISWLK